MMPSGPAMRVCFYIPRAHSLFDPATGVDFGGTEVRAVTFARGLARRGHDVCFVLEEVGKRPRPIDGAELYFDAGHALTLLDHVGQLARRHAEPMPRFPYVRVRRWHPALALTLPVAALRRAKIHVDLHRVRRPRPRPVCREVAADVLCCMGVSNPAADAIHTARQIGMRTVLLVGCDHQVEGTFIYPDSKERGPYLEWGSLAYYALTHADRVVVQNVRQQEVLRARFNIEASLIRNPTDLDTRATPAADVTHPFVLWVGRAHDQKRPWIAADLARRHPDIPFVFLLSGGRPETLEALRAALPANAVLRERVPFQDVERYFAGARLLLSTSAYEGFPNAFLQAAKYAVPILSLVVDPEEMLSRHGCGLTANDNLERLSLLLEELWRDEGRARELGRAARAYVEAHHALDDRVTELEQVLEEVAGRTRPRAA